MRQAGGVGAPAKPAHRRGSTAALVERQPVAPTLRGCQARSSSAPLARRSARPAARCATCAPSISAGPPRTPPSSAPASAPTSSTTPSSAWSSRPAARHIPSRQVSIGVGLPEDVGSDTINKVCASGMRAATLGDQFIRAGDHELVLAGGMESMSNAPYLLTKGRYGYRFGDAEIEDAMLQDALRDPWTGLLMYEQAGQIADRARHRPRRPRRLGRRARTRAPWPPSTAADGRGDRARRDRGPQGHHHRRHRRGPAARHLAREACGAAPAGQGAPVAHRRQLAGRQRRRGGAGDASEEYAESTTSSPWPASAASATPPTATTRWPRCPPPRQIALDTAGISVGRHRPLSRSTRPSPRWPCSRAATSAPTPRR